MDVLIVHYNTPDLTEAAVRSLNKRSPCQVFVFDNSDSLPFVPTLPNVSVIDNTRGQVIDFVEALREFPDKVWNRSNWGSAKHCMSVDRCFDILPDGFILVDSDVLVRRDISPLWDESYAWVGDVHTNTRRFGLEIIRVIPYLCYLNVPMLRDNGIRYFNPDKMWFLDGRSPNMYYDTGAWLYEETMEKGLPYRTVDLDYYALHFTHGSWKEKDGKKWLEENGELWKG